jgi:F-type H+-transporting ATPase subunit c
MKKYVWLLLALFAVALFVPAAFGGQGGETGGGAVNWVAIASGFGYAIAVAGCAYAQGKATAAACEGLARNPASAAMIRFALIIGLVFIESLSLYMFAILYLKAK